MDGLPDSYSGLSLLQRYYLHSAGSGDLCHSAGSGDVRHSAGSGDLCHSAGSGDVCHSAGSGDVRHSAGSGDGCHSAGSADAHNCSGNLYNVVNLCSRIARNGVDDVRGSDTAHNGYCCFLFLPLDVPKVGANCKDIGQLQSMQMAGLTKSLSGI